MRTDLIKRDNDIPENIEVSGIVKPKETYALFQEGMNKPLFMLTGKDIISRFGHKQWINIFNSGHRDFTIGLQYKVILLKNGEQGAFTVWTQTAQNLTDQATGLSDNFAQIQRPQSQNDGFQGNLRSLADVFQVQSTNSIEALRQELANKDVFIKALQEQLNKLYTTLDTKNESFAERELEYIKQIEKLNMEVRSIQEKSSLETWKNQQELTFMKERHAIRSDFDKRKRQLEQDNGLNIKDLVGIASNLFGGGANVPAPTLTNRAVAPSTEPDEMVEV